MIPSFSLNTYDTLVSFLFHIDGDNISNTNTTYDNHHKREWISIWCFATQKSIAITTWKLTMNALGLGAKLAWCNQAVQPTFLAWYREPLMCLKTGGHCAAIRPAFYHPSHTRMPSHRAAGGHYITQMVYKLILNWTGDKSISELISLETDIKSNVTIFGRQTNPRNHLVGHYKLGK